MVELQLYSNYPVGSMTIWSIFTPWQLQDRHFGLCSCQPVALRQNAFAGATVNSLQHCNVQSFRWLTHEPSCLWMIGQRGYQQKSHDSYLSYVLSVIRSLYPSKFTCMFMTDQYCLYNSFKI